MFRTKKFTMAETNGKLSTIGKTISIFETIINENRALSVKELSDILKLNKSSLHHHIKTLTEHRFLQRNEETKKYDIGLNLVRIGQSYLQRIDVRERGHYYLEQLSLDLNKTVHTLVLEGSEVVYIDKVDGNHQPGNLKCSSFIGLRTDVYSTAAGKVLLSHLERDVLDNILDDLNLQQITEYTVVKKSVLRDELTEIKKRNYALDLQEHAMGLQCVAVPILNQHAQCLAAISVSCAVAEVSREMLETEVLTKLQETGQKISLAMGYNP